MNQWCAVKFVGLRGTSTTPSSFRDHTVAANARLIAESPPACSWAHLSFLHFSLAPGFSRVWTGSGRPNRFNGLAGCAPMAGRKPLKRFPHARRPDTQLKPGANESDFAAQ